MNKAYQLLLSVTETVNSAGVGVSSTPATSIPDVVAWLLVILAMVVPAGLLWLFFKGIFPKGNAMNGWS